MMENGKLMEKIVKNNELIIGLIGQEGFEDYLSVDQIRGLKINKSITYFQKALRVRKIINELNFGLYSPKVEKLTRRKGQKNLLYFMGNIGGMYYKHLDLLGSIGRQDLYKFLMVSGTDPSNYFFHIYLNNSYEKLKKVSKMSNEEICKIIIRFYKEFERNNKDLWGPPMKKLNTSLKHAWTSFLDDVKNERNI